METVLTGEPIPKVDPILVLELVLEMDPIPQIPIPAQNTVIPCPILIPTKNGIKTSLITTPEKNVAGRGRGRREWTEWTAARAGDRGRRMSLFVRGRGAKRSYSRFASPQRLWVDQEFEIGINRELA